MHAGYGRLVDADVAVLHTADLLLTMQIVTATGPRTLENDQARVLPNGVGSVCEAFRLRPTSWFDRVVPVGDRLRRR